jgi:peroxiredoxin
MKKAILLIIVLFMLPALSSGQEMDRLDQKLFDAVGVTRFEGDVNAIDFSVKSLSGKTHTLSEFQGKVVFLNFWATWCGPCKVEVKDIETLYNTLKNEDFTVMALDIRESRKKVLQFMKKYDIDFPVYLDEKAAVSSQYGVSGIPTTFIIGPDGKVAGWAIGPRPWGGKDSVDLMRSLMKK